jgi:hypothetical protein
MIELSTLRTKADEGSLEVEDLLEAAKSPPAGLSDLLQELALTYAWPTASVTGSRAVPFGRWAGVIVIYLRDGVQALAPLASEPGHAGFVLGLLEELKSEAALSALLRFYGPIMASPGSDPETAWRVVTALNLMLSFDGAPPVSAQQAEAVRDFLYEMYSLAPSEERRASALLALRGVGDRLALEFVLQAASFKAAWKMVKPVTVAALRERLGPAEA